MDEGDASIVSVLQFILNNLLNYRKKVCERITDEYAFFFVFVLLI